MHSTVYATSPYIYNIGKAGVSNVIFDCLMQNEHKVSYDYTKMLKFACANRSYDEMAVQYGSELVNTAILYKHLLKHSILWEYSNITQASIEINTQCNWKCRFCPNHASPYAKKHMDDSLFEDILRKIDSYGRIKNLSLNFYGEPLIDSYLHERLERILDTRLNLLLFTNGSLIDGKFINAIKRFGSRATICLNIPSIDTEEFTILTGYNRLDKVLNNLEILLQNEINVKIAVNGDKDSRKKNISTINNRFPSITIMGFDTVDRAGAVTNEFFQNISIKENRLFGCQSILHDLQIDIDGNVILCCHDFHKKHKLDNIQNYDSIDKLLKSKNVKLYRKILYGSEDAPADIICRKCSIMKSNKPFSVSMISRNIR